MRKQKGVEEILIDSWEGTRERHNFLSGIPKDAFIGYITAMSMRDNLNIGSGISEWYSTAKRLVEENII